MHNLLRVVNESGWMAVWALRVAFTASELVWAFTPERDVGAAPDHGVGFMSRKDTPAAAAAARVRGGAWVPGS